MNGGWDDIRRLEELKKERKRYKAKTPKYTKIDNAITTLKRRIRRQQQAAAPATPNRQQMVVAPSAIHLDFDRYEKFFKNQCIPKPKIDRQLAFAMFGGETLVPLHILPQLEDAKRVIPNFAPKSSVVEGGIIKYNPSAATELSCEEKNQLINVIGRGFARDTDFSFNDAKKAWGLLYTHKNSTYAVQIYYSYNDPTTNKKMIALAGGMIFSDDVRFYMHDKNNLHKPKRQLYQKTIKVWNLVQITILPQYSHRGLGVFTMKAINQIMAMYDVDWLYWCGCNENFYNICGCLKNPVMIDCPFSIYKDEEKDRNMFFHLPIVRFEDGEYRNKFETVIVEEYNKNPSAITFSIEYSDKNDVLKEYYGLLNNNNNNNNKEAEEEMIHDDTENEPPTRSGSIINEHPSYNIFYSQDGTTTSIMISIQGYPKENLKYDFTKDKKYLIVSGLRMDDDGKVYKFETNFHMFPSLNVQECHGTYADDSSYVTISTKAKVLHVGYSDY